MTHLRLAALVTVAGLALGACSASTPAGSPSQTPSTDPSATVDPSTTAGTQESPEPSGDPSPEPSASRGTSNPPSSAPEDLTVEPAKPGTYTYRQDGTTKAGAFTFDDDAEGTLTIEPPDGERQTQTRTYSDQSSIEQRLLFTEDGVYVERFTSRFFTSTLTCELKSPLLVIPNTTDVGASWKDSGSCDGRSVTAKGALVKIEDRTVGGQKIETYKLQLTLTVKGGGLDQTSRTTSWVSPDHRLIVRSVSHAEGTADGQSFEQDRTEDLVSLSPA